MKKLFLLWAVVLCAWSAAMAETATFGAGTISASQTVYQDANKIVTVAFSEEGGNFGVASDNTP